MLPRFGTRRASGWLPGNAQRRTITVAGVDPRSVAQVGIIDRAATRSLMGAMGGIRAGEGSDPSYRFSGYVAYLDLARQALSPLGLSSNLRGDPNVALPATAGNVAQAARTNSVMDSLALIPPRVR